MNELAMKEKTWPYTRRPLSNSRQLIKIMETSPVLSPSTFHRSVRRDRTIRPRTLQGDCEPLVGDTSLFRPRERRKGRSKGLSLTRIAVRRLLHSFDGRWYFSTACG